MPKDKEKNRTANDALFPEFFAFYVTMAKKTLKKKIEENKLAEINVDTYVLLFEDIYKNLFRLAIRTLISELHNYKEQGKLVGKDTYERYDYFEKLTGQEEFNEYFFNKYPALERIMINYINETTTYIAEIVENFEKDKELLEDQFQVKLDGITDISIGLGDTHNGGRTVAVVYFEELRIVYKPHSLSGDYIYERLLKWINKNANILYDLKNVKVVDLNSRGWQEYIEHRPCSSIEEVQRYYYRMGCYLAIFYSLGTTDLHFENVIASKEFPLFVDLETLFSNSKIDKFSTVLDTGLLPQIRAGSMIDVDTSGICGKSDHSRTMKSLTIIYPKTDEMAVDEIPAFVKNKKNVVIFEEKIVEIEDFVDELINGYDKTINFLCQNKKEFINTILMNVREKSKFRIVLRHTQVYSKYLATALHPYYLLDNEKRQELFQRLQINCRDNFEIERVSKEVEDLLQGSIPYFMFDLDTRNLYSFKGVVKPNYFEYSGYDFLLKRINSLDKNKKPNRDLIKKSLLTSYSKKENYIGKTVKAGATQIDSLFQKYIRGITEGIFDISDEVAMYYFNRLADDTITLEAINVDMYEGGGIILCLAIAGIIYKNDYYLQYSKKLLKSAIEFLKYNHRNQETFILSAFSGYGSLMYLCYLLYDITEDIEYKKNAENTIEYILHNKNFNETSTCTYDYLGGLAGVVVVLANMILAKKNIESRELFDKTTGILNRYLEKNTIDVVGMAHGLSGYAYACVMIYKITLEKKYLKKAKELLLLEDTLYKPTEKKEVSWCNGETGLCISRAKYLELTRDKEITKSLEYYYNTLITKGVSDVKNMCLCHGFFGNIEILREVNKIMNNCEITMVQQDTFEMSRIEDIYLGYNEKFYTDTFMTGLSGIFYVLLREKLGSPSILLLEV